MYAPILLSAAIMEELFIHYSIELIAFSAKYKLFNCNFNLVYQYSLSVNLTLSNTV